MKVGVQSGFMILLFLTDLYEVEDHMHYKDCLTGTRHCRVLLFTCIIGALVCEDVRLYQDLEGPTKAEAGRLHTHVCKNGLEFYMHNWGLSV